MARWAQACGSLVSPRPSLWHFRLITETARPRYAGVYMPTDSEVNACQAAYDPWDGSAYYGWWTTYFILAGFAAIGMVNAFKRLDALNRYVSITASFLHP